MCIPVPDPPVPTLGGGLTIPGIPAPPPFEAGLCCKIGTLALVPIPPVPLVAANAALLTAAILALKAYYRAKLIPKCPKN